MLKEHKIEPYLVHLGPELYCNDDSYWNLDALVINIPPGRRHEDVVGYHGKQIQELTDRLNDSPISFVIFVSSTSVYPELPGIVNENDAIPDQAAKASGNALLAAESLLKQQLSFDTTVIRFGGLYGYDRNPARFLAGKKDLDRGKAPVNLIHRDDSIAIINRIIEQDIRGEVFNAVSDGHPPRNMFYRTMAKALGLAPPMFKKDESKPYKIVSNKRLKNRLQYRFQYPNPMDA